MRDTANHDCGGPEEGWLNLRNAIIETAIDDYKAMIKGEKRQSYENSVKKIERFLMSDYCATLLIDTGMTGEDILRELHSFRDEYYDSLKKKKKGRKKNEPRSDQGRTCRD